VHVSWHDLRLAARVSESESGASVCDAGMASTAGRKLFVGSLPFGIQDAQLRSEFGRFGQVEDIFIKPGCDPSRQWAFITMGAPDQAQTAKEQCDRILVFPGAERPCDVMVAKNQGMFGQAHEVPPAYDPSAAAAYGVPAAAYGAPAVKKIFVGSLPDGIQDAALRAEYSKFGVVEDVFVKPGCEPGRQWAFVTFTTPEQAAHAQELTNGVLMFAGAMRPCEVTMARNQGLFGKDPIAPGPPKPGMEVVRAAMPPPVPVPAPVPMTENQIAPKKIFVGSLPITISDSQLSAEFSKYGNIIDIHINSKPSESGRQWAFITFATSDQAAFAKASTDRVVFFPGAEKACEVTLAKHQGMFGKDSLEAYPHAAPAIVQHGPTGYVDPSQPTAYSPKKVFVGSLPENCNEQMLRAEFSKYGQVLDVHINNKPCEPGRNWAFITFASSDQAQYAKDSTDRVLVMPGADRACEVMIAKNQGKFGQEPLSNGSVATPAVVAPPAAITYAAAQPQPQYVMPQQVQVAATPTQPPPPPTPPPAHLTPWRMYKTAAGLPYYHNAQTGVTQWECPPELQVPGQASPYVIPQQPVMQQVRYAPY